MCLYTWRSIVVVGVLNCFERIDDEQTCLFSNFIELFLFISKIINVICLFAYSFIFIFCHALQMNIDYM